MYMRAIIFDMDGTLLDSEGYWTRAPLVLLERKGIHVDPNNMPWMAESFRKTLKNYFKSPDCQLDMTMDECVAWCKNYMYTEIYPKGVPAAQARRAGYPGGRAPAERAHVPAVRHGGTIPDHQCEPDGHCALLPVLSNHLRCTPQ